ncbi:hypothetical protein, partial [Longibacter sp.]|uniref:hypothetical protein n=1 Tax=Longibacter sp. TaxID=2045415 RepID=UPI003EBD8788
DRIKEAEKKRLRMKKRLSALKRTSERQQNTASLVQKMKRAGASLLRDTQSVVDSLSAEIAKSQARLEVAMDEDAATRSSDAVGEDDVAAYERKQAEAEREARARDLVRQFKESVQPTRTADASPSPRQSDAPTGDETSSSDAPAEDNSDGDLPDKTIGRMRDA